ncbi:MAG: hypothetical protein MI673_10600, partial [Thiotrichales bacterium]|nr:hypothetical protein [Thiotrichales bacterium]
MNHLRLIFLFLIFCIPGTLAAGSLSDRLANAFTRGEDEILDPEQAFRISSRVVNAGTLEISWEV